MKIKFCELEIGNKFSINKGGTLFIKVPVFFVGGGPYNCISLKPATNNYPTFINDKEEIEKL